MRADELKSARRADVFDPLGEVSPQKEGEVDEASTVEVKHGADFRAGDNNKWVDATRNAADEWCLIYQDILRLAYQLYSSR